MTAGQAIDACVAVIDEISDEWRNAGAGGRKKQFAVEVLEDARKRILETFDKIK